VRELVQLAELGTELLSLGQKLRDQTRLAVGAQKTVPRPLQLPEHVDQRHPVEPGTEAVEQRGGFRIVERAELLQLVEPHGEHVVEDRFVDVRKQDLQQVAALSGPVGGLQRDLVGSVGVFFALVAADQEAAVGSDHANRPARPSSVYRRQIGSGRWVRPREPPRPAVLRVPEADSGGAPA